MFLNWSFWNTLFVIIWAFEREFYVLLALGCKMIVTFATGAMSLFARLRNILKYAFSFASSLLGCSLLRGWMPHPLKFWVWIKLEKKYAAPTFYGGKRPNKGGPPSIFKLDYDPALSFLCTTALWHFDALHKSIIKEVQCQMSF